MNYELKIISVGLHLVVGLALVLIVLAAQDWFGSGDMGTYLFWTLPLALSIAFSSQSILNLLPKQRIVRFVGIAFGSIAASLIWLQALIQMLSSWIYAFSIPIVYLFMAASFLQLLFLDWKLTRQEDKPLRQNLLGLLVFPLVMVTTTFLLIAGAIFFHSLFA